MKIAKMLVASGKNFKIQEKDILNLQIYDTFELNHLIIKGLSKDSTIKEILQKIAKMLVASGKNFKIPEKDILN